MAKNTNEKIKKSERTVTTQTSAGSVIATSWAFATTGLEIINQLDAAITNLANLDFSELPSCKGKDLEPDRGFQSFSEYGKEVLDAIPGCTNFSQSIIDAKNDPSAENVTKAIIEGIADLLTPQNVFPACAIEQYRKFLSVIPIQYYLLVLLSKASQELRDAIGKNISESENIISTPCGDSIEKLKEYENLLPEYQIPLLPELPYIKIPSLLSFVENLIKELICFGLCATVTPIISKVGLVLADSKLGFRDYFLGEESEFQPLNKIPIAPYLSPASFESARKRNLIPKNITDEEIVQYISELQNRDDVEQEEFIFLFLGQSNCNILAKIKQDLRTEPVFKLDSDAKIINFFSLLGSFIDFVGLINNSKAKVCFPDPCDIEEEDLNRIVDSLNELCGLLNPKLGLPPLPLSSLMKETGANDAIVDGSFNSYVSVANLNGLANAYNVADGFNAPVKYPVPYIQSYLPASIAQLNASIKGEENKNLRNLTFTKSINFMSYIFPFIVNQITRVSGNKKENFNSVVAFYPGETLPEKAKYVNNDNILPEGYFGELKIRNAVRNKYQIQHFTRYTKPLIREVLEDLQSGAKIEPNKKQDIEEFAEIKKEFGL